MATDNTDAADLANQAFGGIIAEDVLRAVFDISRIPLPFSDRIGAESSRNQFKSWLTSKLPDPNIDNAVVDGSDASAPAENLADRVGNRHQIMEYTVAVSTRAREVDTIGYSDELARQIMEYNQAVRRDANAIYLQPQASVVDDGAAVPGRLGGFPSWLTTTYLAGVAGASGGFNFGTGLVEAPTPGEARGLTLTLVKNAAQQVWEAGGNPSILHGISAQIRGLSSFMFDESAQIATLQRDKGESGAAQAQSSVNVLITDFGVTLEFVADRLQQTYDSADVGPEQVNNLFVYDPEFVSASHIHDVRVDPLGKPGLSDKRQLSLDTTLVVHNEAAHGVVADLDATVAVAA